MPAHTYCNYIYMRIRIGSRIHNAIERRTCAVQFGQKSMHQLVKWRALSRKKTAAKSLINYLDNINCWKHIFRCGRHRTDGDEFGTITLPRRWQRKITLCLLRFISALCSFVVCDECIRQISVAVPAVCVCVRVWVEGRVLFIAVYDQR